MRFMNAKKEFQGFCFQACVDHPANWNDDTDPGGFRSACETVIEALHHEHY